MKAWARRGLWALAGVVLALVTMGPLVRHPAPLPAFMWLPIVLVAIGLVAAGWRVKKRKSGSRAAITPLGAARVALFAVACDRISAFLIPLAGIWTVAYLVALVTTFNRSQSLALGLLTLAAAALFAVALLVEHWCEIDDDAAPVTPPSPRGVAA